MAFGLGLGLGFLFSHLAGIAGMATKTPENYGAVGDGVADDRPAFVAAAAAMALDPSIILSLTKGKTYRIGSAGDITFPAGSVVLGYGLINIAAAASFVFGADSRVCNIAFQTNQDRPIISLVSKDRVFLWDVKFTGDGKGAWEEQGKVSQDAVYIETAEGCALYGCYAYNLGGSLMRCKTTNGGRGGNAAIGCVARECNNAFFADYAGEYMSVTGCLADGCNTGARVSGGNFVWTGGQIVWCRNGARIEDGGNDSHCTFNGVAINHAGAKAVWVDATAHGGTTISNGIWFHACTFYGGAMYFVGVYIGCRFEACTLSAVEWYMSLTNTGSSIQLLDSRYTSASHTVVNTTTVAKLAVVQDRGKLLNGTADAGPTLAV